MSGICTFRETLTNELLYPLFLLIFAVGFIVFVWGALEFMWGLNASSEVDAKQRGKKHMLYGVVGMFIMFVASGIVYLLIDIVGGDVLKCAFPGGSNVPLLM